MRNIGCYIQFTLNDYEDELLEPLVPPLSQRIDTFIELSKCLGKEAAIWRFDPLLLTETLTVEKLLSKIERLGERLHGLTEKLVFQLCGYCFISESPDKSSCIWCSL